MLGATNQPSSEPSPSTSSPFNFACKCLNVLIDGIVSNEDHERIKRVTGSTGDLKCKVYLAEHSERAKQLAFVTYDQDGKRDRRSSLTNGGPSSSEANVSSKRICWACGVKLYEVTGKASSDPPVEGAWVEVDLDSGIISGGDLARALEQPSLPFSHLRLDLPSSSSTSSFGRPPQSAIQSIYTPTQNSNLPLIPPLVDPFFLPPPFIPSHPYLRKICTEAESHLVERHKVLENDVKRYIAEKSREMGDLEEKVRAEVELLWNRYQEGPGSGEEIRRRSLSLTRDYSKIPKEEGKEVLSPVSPDSIQHNPILREASLQQAYQGGASLLAASLSANPAFASVPPPSMGGGGGGPSADIIDDSLNQAEKSYNKNTEQRSVAMSYVFSALDEAMAKNARKEVITAKKKRRESTGGGDKEPRDSWIDEERLMFARYMEKKAAEEKEEMEGLTPRPQPRRELTEEHRGTEEPKGTKGKEKARVTFEDPKPEPEKSLALDENSEEKPDEEDYVFDFEMEDSPVATPKAPADGGTGEQPNISRTRNPVEANLSKTFAADAPSHRAAWRKGGKGSIYAQIRRKGGLGSGTPDEEDDGEDLDDSQVSKLAMSMPLAIALPQRRNISSEALPLERKTSWSERQGILVPPLRAAMREQGISKGNSLGLAMPEQTQREPRMMVQQQRRGSRSASASREREQLKAFKGDAGAVFETLGDEVDSDEDDDEGNGVDGGTLRENTPFVPPHVLARKVSRQSDDVGWRSMITE